MGNPRVRYRSSDSGNTPVYYTHAYTSVAPTCANPNGTYTEQGMPHAYKPWSVTEEMHDVVEPDYARLSKLGIVVNNPMQKTIVTEIDSPVLFNVGHVHRHRGLPGSTCPYVWLWWSESDFGETSVKTACSVYSIPHLSPPAVDGSGALIRAATSAYAKRGTQEVAGAVMALELDKSIQSICSILYRLARILRAAKRLQFQKLRRELSGKELANRWLEVRYALRPLVYDMGNTVDAFARLRDKRTAPRVTSRGFDVVTGEDADEYVVVQNPTPGLFTKKLTITGHRAAATTYSARVGVLDCIVDTSPLSVLGLNHGWEVVWELIPFSFIIDWFFNVAETLAAHSPEMGVEQLASWVSVIKTTIQSISLSMDVECTSTSAQSICSYVTATIDNPSWIVTTIDKTRVPYSALTEFPQVKLRFSVSKLLDLLLIAKRIWR